MKNATKNREITALLVSNNESDIREIKMHLEKTMGLSCHILLCAGVADSVAMFGEGSPAIDIVLLDLGLIGSDLPREVFRQMGDIVSGVPIIVFTEREDHELALLVIGDGAVDNVTRGQFSTDPFKLRDAIEFSLARRKISIAAEMQGAAALDRLGMREVANCEDLRMHGEAELMDAKRDTALSLEKEQQKNAAHIKEKDDIIFWMSGGYSVDARRS